MKNITWPLLVVGNVLLLCGCADVTTTGYSTDEDLMPPPGTTIRTTTSGASHLTASKSSGLSNLTSGPTYGSTGFQTTTTSSKKTTTITRLTSGPTYGATHFEKINLPPPEAKPAASTADETSTDFDNLEIISPGLKNRLLVTRVGSDRTEDNLLSVFAGLKNKSAHPLQIEVQTLYKDKMDHSLSDGRKSWIPLTLKPHGETQYRSVAISEDATDFVVRIRHAAP